MWYIQKKGRAEGPIPDATITHAIGKGDLGPYDLVFRDGESRWQVLSEVPQFAALFEKPQKKQAATEDSWVVLVKVDGHKDRRQKGPFSTSQLKAMLKNSQILLTDYVWKDGMKEWYRVHSLELLHRESDAKTTSGLTPEVPTVHAGQHELYKNVKIMEQPALPPPEPVPPEAINLDLTKTNARLEPLIKPAPRGKALKVRERTSVASATNVSQARSLSFLDRVRALPWPRRGMWRVGFAAVAALAAVSALYFMTYHDWQELAVKKIPPAKPVAAVEMPSAPEAVPADMANMTENRPLPKPTPEPATPPSYLRLKLSLGQTGAAALDIQTNASKHFSVRLRITGEAGRVIGTKSFYKEVKVKMEDRRLKIESLGLPAGYYSVVAQLGDFEERISLSWKQFDKNFKSDFSEHRKNIVYFATQERYYLFKSAEYLEGKANMFNAELTKSPKALAGFYREWSKSLQKTPGVYLKAISSRNRRDYVYAEEWLKLKGSQAALGEAAKALLKAKDTSVPEAGNIIRQLALDLQRQKEAALQASLWR